MDIQLSQIGTIIQLAIAPALLLVGVGIEVRVLANRLDRIVDRIRELEERLMQGAQRGMRDASVSFALELGSLLRRRRSIERGIGMCVCCTLLISLVIVTLFLSDAFDVDLDGSIAIMFIVGMGFLIGSFLCFLHEIYIAAGSLILSFRHMLIKRD